MDVTSSLLVAMMFVMVLSIGIGNILLGLSSLLVQRSPRDIDWLPTSWLLLLLLQHLNMFWHTLTIIEVEQWGFGGFLYIVAGPILLFLASSLLLADPNFAGPSEPRVHYFRVAARFFAILAVLMLWMIGVDFVLGTGFTPAGAWNAALFVLFLILARSQDLRLHITSTVVTWVLLVSLLASRSFGLV
jgi:predicted membrane protein